MHNLKSPLVCVRLSSQALSLLTLAFAMPIDAAASGLEFVPNEVIVQYRPDFDSHQKAGQVQSRLMQSSHKAMLLSQQQRTDGRGDLALLQLPSVITSSQEMAKTIAQLEQDPTVEYAEPNWVYHKLDTGVSYRQNLAKTYQHKYFNFPNDTYYRNGESWGMYGDKTLPKNPYGSQAGEAWGGKRRPIDCSDVYIGVIDEGIMTTHPDLKASIWRNPYDPIDGIDNDGNGYVDDSNGWDFYYDDRTVYHQYEDFHGSHVAGIISAQGNNGIGVAGVCWKAKLVSAKFLGPDGGDTVNAIKAIDYITDLKVRHGLNIVATNNSWGGGGYSRAMIDAIKRAEKVNILFIAAAGNDGTNNDELPLYPASYINPNIISVTSITQNGLLPGGANIGVKSVDIAAPGEGILSTVPDFDGNPDYGYDGGTSMAAPFVTGAAALYAHKHPKAHYPSTKRAILNSAEPTADFVGLTVTGDRLDVSRIAKR